MPPKAMTCSCEFFPLRNKFFLFALVSLLYLTRCALEKAGIYVVVGLAQDCPQCAITRDSAPSCYPPELKRQGQNVIQAFSKYSNTLAFSAGNEVNHFAPPNQPQWNAPCQKKFLRDMRQYVAFCAATDDNFRKIPIGLVSADDSRQEVAKYYNCRSDPHDVYETAEWYGLNTYVFCNGTATTFDEAEGFQALTSSFQDLNFSIPVLLTEFGCLSDSFPTNDGYEAQRSFLQAKWLLTEKSVRDQFAGGFVFEYSTEMENAKSESPFPFRQFGHQNYGVGYFEPENCDGSRISCSFTRLPSFENLKRAYSNNMSVALTRWPVFQAPQSRQKSSECPQKFSTLDSFHWDADETPFLKCPDRLKRFTCPTSNQLSKRNVKTNGTAKIDFGNLRDLILALIFAIVVAVILTALVLIRLRQVKWFPLGLAPSQSERPEDLLSMLKSDDKPSYNTLDADSLEGEKRLYS